MSKPIHGEEETVSSYSRFDIVALYKNMYCVHKRHCRRKHAILFATLELFAVSTNYISRSFVSHHGHPAFLSLCDVIPCSESCVSDVTKFS